MEPKRWQAVRAEFDELVELGSGEQAERLALLCTTHPELGASVSALLDADCGANDQLEPLESALLVSPEQSASRYARDPFGLTGKMMGHFRILEPLESGGMGAVYKAEDTRLNRIVAVKIPLPAQQLDDSSRRRFLREARSVAALDHPSLCSIHEIGESDGRPFLAMPLYPGETLQARLAREGPLPVDDALNIARQIAEGLAAAHDAGIVHRDVKPGNVMLLPHGTVKLLDFGLAKSDDVTLTLSHANLGTVSYMSPEQVSEVRVDARTDLWALGALLYEAVTGHRPFKGERAVAIAQAILHEEPARPSTLRHEIPPALEGLLFSLLRKNPAHRPATARQVAAELLSIRSGVSSGAATEFRHRWLAVTGWRRRRWFRWGIYLAAVATLVAGALFAKRTLREPAATTIDAGSIAVLPFSNLSADREQEYLSDGITDELTTYLAKVSGLRVAARTSAFQFKGRNPDVRRVGTALGVASVLQGTVQKNGSRLRVTAQLTDAANGYTVWAETYDRETSDVFTMQDEISRGIVTALRVRLDRPMPARLPSTSSAEAHDLYLKGRYFWNQRSEAALIRAKSYFAQAVSVDSGYADAYSGLADIEIAPRPGRPAERFERAKAAASRAVTLDPTLPEAHLSMGWISMWYDRRWADAEHHFLRAIELNPRLPWAIAWYAAYLAAVGRLEESLPLIERAQRLDPLNYVHATYVGMHYLWFRQPDAAAAQFRKSLELQPNFYMAHWGLARVYVDKGRYTQALAELQYDGGDFTGLHRPGLLGYAYGKAGNVAAARKVLSELKATASRGEYVPPVDVAIIHISLGEKEQALDALERIVGDRGARIFIVDPIFDPLRAEPRFIDILRRLGLSETLVNRKPLSYP